MRHTIRQFRAIRDEPGGQHGRLRAIGRAAVINATCHWTIYGGSVMWPEVIEAMAEARQSCVDMRALLDQASEVISRHTHAEASYVVSGCAAALQAGAAAILTGDDPVKMAALPHTAGLMKRAVHRPPLPAPPRRPMAASTPTGATRRQWRGRAATSWRSAADRDRA